MCRGDPSSWPDCTTTVTRLPLATTLGAMRNRLASCVTGLGGFQLLPSSGLRREIRRVLTSLSFLSRSLT